MKREDVIEHARDVMFKSPREKSASQLALERSVVRAKAKMAFYFESWWTELYVALFLGFVSYYAYFKLVASKHWENRNIAHMDPVFLLGNLWKSSIIENLDILLLEVYRKYKNDKLVGFWNFTTPVLAVTDINLIKNMLVRDFNHFRDHGFEVDFEREPLAAHLFNLKGAKWRNLRVKLTPTFTSGKMKMMFPTVVKCGEELQNTLKGVAESGREVEVKEILARFTTDVISSCAFGIETNSLKNPDSEFRKFGKKLFEPSFRFIINNIIFGISPFIFNLLKLRLLPEDVSEFFLNAVKDTMRYRETNAVKRNDFMELLIQLKNKGHLEDADGTPLAGLEEEVPVDSDNKFTVLDAAAQAIVFFLAGFETSSTTITFALYELALNTDIQDTLLLEIDGVLAKFNGEITYEGVMNMEYLDWVVQETLRKHPPVGSLFRECNKDYEIPELNTKIEKKTVLFISTLAIHRDPEIYPNPDKFDPKRFSPEEKAKRDHFAYLPFGEGPRMCIGNRFGLMQVKTGLVLILSRYRVLVSSRTPSPLVYDPSSFILTSKDGMHLKFAPRGNLHS